MTEKNQKIILKFMLGLAVFLHILFYNFQPLSFDELLMYDLWSKIGFNRLFEVLWGLEFQGPLFYLIGKTLHQFSDQSLVLRLPSLISFLLLIYVFLRLGRDHLGEKQALVGAIILCLSHPLFVFSSSMRPYLSLVLLVFITLIVWIELQINKPTRHKISLFLILLILGPLVHPQVLVLSPLFLFSFLKRKEGMIIFALLCLVGTGIVYVRWLDLISLASFNLNLMKILYDLSYALSGLFASLIFCMIFLKSAIEVFWKKTAARETKLIVIFVLYNLIAYSLISFVFPAQLAGRHLLLILVPMVYLTVKNNFHRKFHFLFIFLFLLIALIYRSFFDQPITQKSTEFNSSLIALSALEMSKRTPHENPMIYSCGNCLSYYIDQQHTCFGSFLPNEELFKLQEEYIYIEFLHGGKGCHQNNLMPRVQLRESVSVPGAKIYRIKSIR